MVMDYSAIALDPTYASAAITAAATIGAAITASQAGAVTASAYVPCPMKQLLISAFGLRNLSLQVGD